MDISIYCLMTAAVAIALGVDGGIFNAESIQRRVIRMAAMGVHINPGTAINAYNDYKTVATANPNVLSVLKQIASGHPPNQTSCTYALAQLELQKN